MQGTYCPGNNAWKIRKSCHFHEAVELSNVSRLSSIRANALVVRTLSVVAVCCLVAQLCLFETPQTVAYQATLSVGFSRQEYWSGLPFPSPGDLPDPGIEPKSTVSPALACRLFTTEPPEIDLKQQRHQTSLSSVQFSHSIVYDSLRPHESQHARPPCPSPTLGVYPNSCSSSW